MSLLQLRYGPFVHSIADAAVSINRATMFNDAGLPYAEHNIWAISGRLEGPSQDNITTQIAALESAYRGGNRSPLRLEFADTGAATAHEIQVDNTIDGIKITATPSFPMAEGAEYANFRNYTIVVEASVVLTPYLLYAQVIAYEERVAVSGGFPRDILVETLNTAPIRQRVADATITYIAQSGRKVQLFQSGTATGWPLPSPMYYPQAVIYRNDIQNLSPRQGYWGGQLWPTMFETTWEYAFGLDTQNMQHSAITYGSHLTRPMF